MNVLWITNIPSPYRVNFFNELGRKVSLTVLFERRFASNRDSSWIKFSNNYFSTLFLKSLNVSGETAIGLNIFSVVNYKLYDYIIISNPLTPTGILLSIYLNMRGIKYIIESDGAFKKNYESNLLKKIKKIVFKNSWKCFSTGEFHDQYYLDYGVEKGNIVRYPFTSVYFDEIEGKLDNRRNRILADFDIPVAPIYALSVGQFVDRKGFQDILKISNNFEDKIHFVIIGGPNMQKYNQLITEKSIKNVTLINFMKKETLSEFYRFADIFILPTYNDPWGLVINEAMAKSNPIITTYQCGAGNVLVNESNGYLFNAGDISELKRILINFSNRTDREKLESSSNSKIKLHTLEKMVEKHYEFFVNNLNG